MKQVLLLTKKLISIPSTFGNTTDNEKILYLTSKLLKKFPIQVFENNGVKSILISNGNNQKRFKVLFNAHLDVVPGLKKQYKLINKNGKLYGRGVYDMKAATAVFIVLFKELAKTLPYSLGLQLVVDEEVGGACGTKYQISRGVTADFVIAGEPTDFAIGNESKGILSLEITSKGKSAHAAYLWEGKNALIALLPVVEKILQTFPIPTKDSWKTTANLAWIQTNNTTSNKVPDRATARFDFRYIPEDKDNIQKRISSLIPNGMEYKIFSVEDGQKVSEEDIFINLLQKSAKQTFHKPLKFLKNNGASDVRYYSSKGISAITFGPKGHGLHSDNEWVEEKSLEEYYTVIKTFLLSL